MIFLVKIDRKNGMTLGGFRFSLGNHLLAVEAQLEGSSVLFCCLQCENFSISF
jgi:hypothetical protein